MAKLHNFFLKLELFFSAERLSVYESVTLLFGKFLPVLDHAVVKFVDGFAGGGFKKFRKKTMNQDGKTSFKHAK